MNIDDIVQQLKEERTKLDAAIAALEGVAGGGKRRGRPAGSKNRSTGRRTMSASARKRISEMMKKRWTERKKAKK